MTDQSERTAAPAHNPADSLVHIWHAQNTVGEVNKLIPAIKEAGSGFVLSKDGTDCTIQTDSHVVSALNKVSVPLDKNLLTQLNVDPAQIELTGNEVIPMDLDTQTKFPTYVQLANGKAVEAQIIENNPELDRAVLKVKTAELGACNPLAVSSGERLTAGEAFTGLSSGLLNNPAERPLLLAGEKTVGEIKDILSRHGIAIDDSMRKLKDSMPMLIFRGEVHQGDSGGPVVNNKGVSIGRLIAGGPIAKNADGTKTYVTFVAPVDQVKVE